jgi:DNA-binding transcriptional ArsR family regulator
MMAVMRHAVSWTALTSARLVLLDEEFFQRTAQWPEVAGALLERAGRLGQRLALRGAIETLSVDARLLATFWLWASQWATVAGHGVVLRVPLSHERIARLIHARRPTVTSALGRLRGAGVISQRKDGSWLLRAPQPDTNGDGAQDGISMHVLSEMLDRRLGVRAKGPVSTHDTRAAARRELRERLEEQRETLRVATERHQEMLERLRKETRRLSSSSPERRRG